MAQPSQAQSASAPAPSQPQTHAKASGTVTKAGQAAKAIAASAKHQSGQGEPTVHVDAKLIGTLPKQPLSPTQQLQALKKVKDQAEARIQLGKQLLVAANTRLTQQHEALQAIRQEQQVLRDQLQDDVAHSLQQYDQWMGQADERFTQRFQALEARMEKMEQDTQAMRLDLQLLLAKLDRLAAPVAPAAPSPDNGPTHHSPPASAASMPPNQPDSDALDVDLHANAESSNPPPSKKLRPKTEADPFGQWIDRLMDDR